MSSPPLEIVSRLPESNLVKSEDVVALICLAGGTILTAINTNNKGIIKVWNSEFQLLHEFVAHEFPIYFMTNGLPHQFFTSASDCTIAEWVAVKERGCGQWQCEKLTVMKDMQEPAWRMRFVEEENRLYSGDSTGEVRMWENGELVGCLGTVEEVWDMLVDQGVLYTTRHLDVYLTNLKTKDDEKVMWCIKNVIEGTGPLLIHSGKLCLMSRHAFAIQVHSLEGNGNTLLATLEGHEALTSSLVSYKNVLFSGGYDGKVIAWDLETFKRLGEVKVGGYINSMAVDQESGILYVGGENRFVCAIKLG